jgi:probable F420-dependent oxidoreductase
MPLRLGLGLPQMKHYDIRRDVTDVARAAELLGYQSLWVFERTLFPNHPDQGLYNVAGLPWPPTYRSVADPLVVLALAAAATDRADLGTSVLVAPLHRPFQLARGLASLSAAAGGRVVAGLGTGWSRDEYAAAGVPIAERGARLDELLDVCDAVWGPDPVGYETARSRVRDAEVGPKPAQPIAVYLTAGHVTASGARPLARVAARADGWMTVGGHVRPMVRRWEEIREAAAAHGRDPEGLAWCVRANVELTKDPIRAADRRPFTGTVEQVVEDLLDHAEAGVDEVIVELQSCARGAAELKDLAARVYADARSAGV